MEHLASICSATTVPYAEYRLGIEEPTWEEFYGENVEEAKPFDEFFTKGNEDEEELFLNSGFNAVRDARQHSEGCHETVWHVPPLHVLSLLLSPLFGPLMLEEQPDLPMAPQQWVKHRCWHGVQPAGTASGTGCHLNLLLLPAAVCGV